MQSIPGMGRVSVLASFTGSMMGVDYFPSRGMDREIVALDRIVSDGPSPDSRSRLTDDLHLSK
jgi:hypothetical protein